MRVYFSAADTIYSDVGSWDSGTIKIVPTATVFEDEPQQPTRTGIVDHRGTPIFAVETRERVGFDLTRKP